MTCKRMAPLLSRYHDGVLNEKQRGVVAQHVLSCPDCANRLSAYQMTQARIAGALRVQPSPAFHYAVLAATTQRRPVDSSIRPGHRHLSQIAFGGMAGASVALLMVLVFALATGLTGRQQAHHVNLASSAPPTVQPSVRRHVQLGTARPTSATSVPSPTSVPRATAATTQVQMPTAATSTAAWDSRGHARAPVDRAGSVRLARAAVVTQGAVHGPLWSPDSSSLLYLVDWGVHCRDDWYCGTLRLRTTGGTITLAQHVRSYTYSPDSRLIAYTADRTQEAPLLKPMELHEVRVDGSGDRVLGDVEHTNVQWLAEGIVAVRDGRVMLVDPATAARQPLTRLPALRVADDNEAFLAVSSHARFFAYQDDAGLRVWDRARGGVLVLQQRLTRFLESSFHFSWDGNTIFFSTYDAGGYTMLYRQQLSPLKRPTALNAGLPLHGPINLVGPPSADNSIVSFRIGANAQARNYVIGAAFGRAHALYPPEGVGPVGWWSPDGRDVVYTVYRGDEAQYTGIARVLQR